MRVVGKLLKILLIVLLGLGCFSVCYAFLKKPNEELHVHIEECINEVTATCVKSGLSAGVKCSECGEILTEQKVLPALGHTERVITERQATCTQKGLTQGKDCSVCGEVLTLQEELLPLGHTERVIVGKEATCTQKGLTQGKDCSVCGEVIQAQEEINTIAHTELILVNGTDPTCEVTGTAPIVKCQVCNIMIEKQGTVALGHKEVTVGEVLPTCLNKGLSTGKKCVRCGIFTTPQTQLDAIGHIYGEWQTTVDSECETIQVRSCIGKNCRSSQTNRVQHNAHYNKYEGYECYLCGKQLVTVDSSTGYIIGCVKGVESLIFTRTKVNGIEVTGIDDRAFYGSDLIYVEIHEQLDYVGYQAFAMSNIEIFYVKKGINIYSWDGEWYYGNGDLDTPFMFEWKDL